MPTQVIGPSLRPRPTEEEALAAFDSIPLFMQSLPEENGEDTSLAALQSLIYDDTTPDEIATNFKGTGNDYYRGKRYREAMGFYTQGIDAKPTDPAILEALLCNRAACNLELQNYGSVLRDCSRVLTLNPRSSKAFYRSSQALINLQRFEEALDCCSRCLAYDSTNAGILSLREKATKLKDEADRKAHLRQEQKRKEDESKLRLKTAFQDRNLLIFNKPDGSANPAEPHFVEDELVLPVFFLYPQHATSDVISKFVENTTFASHLEVMFPPQASPPEWDKKGEYIANNLVVYAPTHRRRLLKVGKRMTLLDVCKAAKEKPGQPKDGLEMKDNCLSFVVLPKGEVETKWVEEYKKLREQAG